MFCVGFTTFLFPVLLCFATPRSLRSKKESIFLLLVFRFLFFHTTTTYYHLNYTVLFSQCDHTQHNDDDALPLFFRAVAQSTSGSQ